MRIGTATPRDQDGSVPPTPGQTIGPFFGYVDGFRSVLLPFRDGQHLVPPGHPQAVRLTGTVRDGAGAPVPDALLEIWQADGEGRIARNSGSLARDGWTFTGWGRGTTDREGVFTFTTVDPGPVEPGRAAFIALVVFARGLPNKLHTRVYLPEDTAALAQDPVLSALDEERRRTLIARRGEDGSLRFDVWLQQPEELDATETVFLQFPGMEYPGTGSRATPHPSPTP